MNEQNKVQWVYASKNQDELASATMSGPGSTTRILRGISTGSATW